MIRLTKRRSRQCAALWPALILAVVAWTPVALHAQAACYSPLTDNIFQLRGKTDSSGVKHILYYVDNIGTGLTYNLGDAIADINSHSSQTKIYLEPTNNQGDADYIFSIDVSMDKDTIDACGSTDSDDSSRPPEPAHTYFSPSMSGAGDVFLGEDGWTPEDYDAITYLCEHEVLHAFGLDDYHNQTSTTMMTNYALYSDDCIAQAHDAGYPGLQSGDLAKMTECSHGTFTSPTTSVGTNDQQFVDEGWTTGPCLWTLWVPVYSVYAYEDGGWYVEYSLAYYDAIDVYGSCGGPPPMAP